MSWLWFGIGLAIAIIGIGWSIALAGSGEQPWSAELSDNIIFARALPSIIAFGILSGLARALVHHGGIERGPDGAVRRFAPATALNHWINAIGFLLALTTGSIQYLKGVVDFGLPMPIFWVYRFHFIGASLMVYSASLFVTYRLLVSDRPLVPAPGQWIMHLRGLAHELPKPVGGLVASVLGLDMRRQPPLVQQFTYYEKAFSFPVWMILLALIVLTGLVKAMKYLIPIPGDVLFWASALHVAAMVLLAAKFLDHLRYVFTPSRWPLLRSMVTTWVSERYVQLRHPAWHEAIRGEAGRPAETLRGQAAPLAEPSGGGPSAGERE